MTMIDPKVIETASVVRLWAEERAKKIQDTDPEDLSCYCAIASTKHSLLLTLEGIKHRIAMAESIMGNHVFLLVNGWIVDVTATQFGQQEKIFAKHEHAADLGWYHRINRTFFNARELILWQKKKGWPENQIIQKYELAPV